MLIKFNKVIAHNFLSLGHVEFSLDNNGTVLVEGINTNVSDCASSNGSGKSSLFNAICWCLTGETIQGVSNNICNIFSDGSCYVTLNFDLNNNSFEVTRQKDDKTHSLKITKNGQDVSGKGIRESTKVLEYELGDLTSELIGSIIVLGQGLPHRFSNNTPAGRKELLEKLSKSDFMIEDIKNRLNSRKDELGNDLGNKKNYIVEEKAKLDIYDGYIVDSKNKLENLQGIDFSGIKTLNDLVEMTEDGCRQKQAEIDKVDETINHLTEQLLNATSKRDEEISQVQAEHDKQVEPLLVELKRLDRELDDTKFKIKHADDDICPTCGQRIPDKEHIDKQPLLDKESELENKLNDIQNVLNELKESTDNAKAVIMTTYSVANLSASINSANKEKQELQKSLTTLNNNKSDYATQLATMRAELEAYEKNIEQLNQVISLNEARKQSSEEKIVYYNEEVDGLSQHLDVVNQMLTIVKRDFRGYLLTNVIDFINAKANEYANVVFGNKRIRFELDGNNINIMYCDKPYENLSGGEKQKLDLIIQFALKDMLSSYLNIYCNILVLDEIFDNLDAIGCEKVLNLIASLDDVSSVYIISHHADELQIPYDSKIVIEKDSSGISRLVNAV